MKQLSFPEHTLHTEYVGNPPPHTRDSGIAHNVLRNMLLQNINEEEGELYKSRFIPSKYLPRVKFSERIVTYILLLKIITIYYILYVMDYIKR